MRVVMITERYYPIWGGAENQLRQLARHLISMGCQVKVITRRWSAKMPPIEQIDQIYVHRVGCPGNSLFAKVIFILSMNWKLFCLRRQTDVIHSHGAVAMGALASLASRLFGSKNISKIATAGRILKYQKSFFGSLLLFLFKHSDAIIAMTDEIREELERIGAPKKRIFRIANAVNSKRFFPYPEKQRQDWKTDKALPSETLIVLFSGRLTFRKGLMTLLDAWPMVERKVSRARLFILGSGSAQENTVESKAQKKVTDKALKNVYFEGATTSPESYLGVADIFVFPSFREGMPNALLEAMASGVPIIASEIGGVVDLVSDGETGILFHPGDEKELANKIIYMSEQPVIRYQIGDQARKHMLTYYSFEKIAQQYMRVYRRVLAWK